MRYAWILKNSTSFSTSTMCRLLKVKQDNYYHYKREGVVCQATRQQENQVLQTLIKEEFITSRKHSGSRRIKTRLELKGVSISRTLISKLMT